MPGPRGGGGLRGRRALGVRRSASPRAVSGPSEDSSVCEKTHARGRGQRHVSRRNQSVSLRSPAREQESGRIRLLDATELRRSTGPGDFCATEKDTDSSPSPRSLLESGLGAHALKREQPPKKKGNQRNRDLNDRAQGPPGGGGPRRRGRGEGAGGGGGEHSWKSIPW